MKSNCGWILLGGMILANPGESAAQTQRPSARTPSRSPTVSPYINLLRREDRRLMYQGIIRPQIESNRAQRLQQAEIQQLGSQFHEQRRTVEDRFREQEREILELMPPARVKAVETGHPVGFMRRETYFPGFRRQ